MGCPTVKKAFEDSLNKSTINNTDKFLTYDNGTVYNVTYGDFITQLGVTGSLSTGGGANAIPVLGGAAPNYVIRGIVGANGITAQQGAQGAVVLSTNIQNAGSSTAGEGIVVNESADPLKLKRLKAGAGVRIDSSANTLTIVNTQAIEDTKPRAVEYLQAGTTTTISATGDAVQINGAFVESESNLFDVNSDGSIVYTGQDDVFINLDALVSFAPDTGSSIDLFLQFLKNDLRVDGSKFNVVTESSQDSTVNLQWGLTLSKNDKIAVATGNDTDTADIVVSQLILRAS